MSDTYQTRKRVEEIADYVMRCGQLAAALEVCGWPKPGNVHRTANFPDTRFEHFIAGSVSMGPALREAAVRGAMAKLGEVRMDELGVGRLIRRAVADMKAWHRGGNTHLGVIMLFIPTSAAAGMTLINHDRVDVPELRRNFADVMDSTTSMDAAYVYEAINLANPGGLGKFSGEEAPDLTSPDAGQSLIRKGLTLKDVMDVSSRWDTVAREMVTALEISCGVGYPTLLDVYSETGDINVAVVHTYLKLLSLYPDTFVARHVGLKHTSDIAKAVEMGMKKAREVSKRADEILRLGGLTTTEGREALFRFDEELRSRGLNPGTTADLTAASLMIAILNGLRF